MVLEGGGEALDARGFESAVESGAVGGVVWGVEVEWRASEAARVGGDDGAHGGDEGGGVEGGGFNVVVAREEIVAGVLGCVGEGAEFAKEVVFRVDGGGVVADDGGRGVDALLGEGEIGVVCGEGGARKGGEGAGCGGGHVWVGGVVVGCKWGCELGGRLLGRLGCTRSAESDTAAAQTR